MSQPIIFVATRIEDVPEHLGRYLSVDGSVPGAAVTWDHHRSGEVINLDAMPDRVDIEAFDGIGAVTAAQHPGGRSTRVPGIQQ